MLAKAPPLWPFVVWLGLVVSARAQESLPGTEPLTPSGDLSAQMVAGIDRFLLRETQRAAAQRSNYWHRDFTSPESYQRSVQTNRDSLRRRIGAVDPRLPVERLELVASSDAPAVVGETETFTVQRVRWPVFEDVFAEGLWLQPKGSKLARVVAIGDADQTPEMLAGLAPGLAPERQFARRLVENGSEVLIPTLVDRHDTWSGNEAIHRFTNQPHREWIYRQAFMMGRHIIGYEVQEVLAAVDFLERSGSKPAGPGVGVIGYAEGGLIALYSAALDPRIAAVVVSGYFDDRQRLWAEPIYRNVFGLLDEFGDAEIATLVAPRTLIVEHSQTPKVLGPPEARSGRSGAAPGHWQTPDYTTVEAEFERAKALLKPGSIWSHAQLITGNEGLETGPGSDRALAALLEAFSGQSRSLKPPGTEPKGHAAPEFAAQRQHRLVKQWEDYTQGLLRESDRARADFFWSKIKAKSAQEWSASRPQFAQTLWEEVIGRFPSPTSPAQPRSRKIYDRPKWTGYEVVLDVYPDVFAWGYLLVPKDLQPSERRPVVVCQHGLEGLPEDAVNDDPKWSAYHYYKGFAAKLADQGFVTFAPHNPYRGGDRFRVLQRKANPIGKSLFSVIIAQHEQILNWLEKQPFVDPRRIGFYGLSYGGKTAMRVPAVLDRYALSICSADFNDWVRKNADTDFPLSYMFMGEYELPEFDLGNTFNYAEMGALIAPRPFMVERGHRDGVGIDEWVASEFAKVRRFYDEMGIGDRASIEFFNGDHTINGVGTFEFLHRHLDWPQR
jgi:dienelactone hydrolase